jgi:hypothetical protein
VHGKAQAEERAAEHGAAAGGDQVTEIHEDIAGGNSTDLHFA